MGEDIQKYLESHSTVHREFAARVGTQLARNGIDDIGQLCSLLAKNPEDVRRLRNIGVKSMSVIYNICKVYQNEERRRP